MKPVFGGDMVPNEPAIVALCPGDGVERQIIELGVKPYTPPGQPLTYLIRSWGQRQGIFVGQHLWSAYFDAPLPMPPHRVRLNGTEALIFPYEAPRQLAPDAPLIRLERGIGRTGGTSYDHRIEPMCDANHRLLGDVLFLEVADDNVALLDGNSTRLATVPTPKVTSPGRWRDLGVDKMPDGWRLWLGRLDDLSKDDPCPNTGIYWLELRRGAPATDASAWRQLIVEPWFDGKVTGDEGPIQETLTFAQPAAHPAGGNIACWTKRRVTSGGAAATVWQLLLFSGQQVPETLDLLIEAKVETGHDPMAPAPDPTAGIERKPTWATWCTEPNSGQLLRADCELNNVTFRRKMRDVVARPCVTWSGNGQWFAYLSRRSVYYIDWAARQKQG
ncbi:MAG: hypothetical protein HZB16_22765 [Armatimonadetes bacterium]|nr:hypothetical protein [Armatimonadota bacterium]